MSGPVTLALVGNPNGGKTTLFNRLTGMRQRVANWPGVTVEKKTGAFRFGALRGTVVDLPGVYALVPLDAAEDERIARHYLAAREADVVVNIVDASNLERHLYVTVQLLEQGYPVVVALNMMDVARANGVEIDVEGLSARLGCPVVPMAATRGDGMEALEAAVAAMLARSAEPRDLVDHGPQVEAALGGLAALAVEDGLDATDARRLAVRLMERDPMSIAQLSDAAQDRVAEALDALEAETGEPPDLLLAEGRYGFILETSARHLRRRLKLSRRASDAIDRVMLSPWLGFPVFLALMYAMFTFTISFGGAFIDFFDIAAGTVFVDGTAAALGAVGAPDWLIVILADGVGGGLQTVATFIPIIGCLFLFLAVLEDSGYMARAAVVMDRLMRAIGLPGKAFMPLLVGFGCNVPAVMATRILADPRDRKTTIMMIPFMSCGARVPIYALFAAAFFPANGQNVVFLLYLIGIAVAVATGFALKRTLLAGGTPALTVVELPRYHFPTVRNVLLRTWDRLRGFVEGAGKIIVIMVTGLSILGAASFDGRFGDVALEDSALADVGRAITPALAPMGVTEENWPATVGVFTGLFAKEAVVGTLDSLYGALAADGAEAEAEAGGFDLVGGLSEAIASIGPNLYGLGAAFLDPLAIDIGDVADPEAAAEAQAVATGTFGAMAARFDGRAGAFAYLLFTLLYFPCFAAMGAVYRELGGAWTAFAGVWTTGLAYGAATVFYQAATWSRSPETAAIAIGAVLAALIGALVAMRLLGRRMRQAPLASRAAA